MSYFYCFRNPKTHQEMSHNAATEVKKYVRAKRNSRRLPNSWDDIPFCDDIDTKRQIRRSQNNFRVTIRKMNV